MASRSCMPSLFDYWNRLTRDFALGTQKRDASYAAAVSSSSPSFGD